MLLYATTVNKATKCAYKCCCKYYAITSVVHYCMVFVCCYYFKYLEETLLYMMTLHKTLYITTIVYIKDK